MDCSGRSLATLLIAWVGAAMVASILLQWKYMWIALAILSLLFLFVCGYTACTARRTHGRAMIREEARVAERERRQEREIETVSGRVDGSRHEGEPPMYQTYWVTDLPPSYASVIGARGDAPTRTTPTPTTSSSTADDDGRPRTSRDVATENDRASSTRVYSPPPPPYSLVVESETGRRNVPGVLGGEPTTNVTEAVNDFTAMRLGPNLPGLFVGKRDKTEETETETRIAQPNQAVNLGANCLSNIFNYTFGRSQRTATNDNATEPENVGDRNRINANRNVPEQQSFSESETVNSSQSRQTDGTAIARCNSF